MEKATRRSRAPRLVVHQLGDFVVLLKRAAVELEIYRNWHLLIPFSSMNARFDKPVGAATIGGSRRGGVPGISSLAESSARSTN